MSDNGTQPINQNSIEKNINTGQKIVPCYYCIVLTENIKTIQ